jgi:hypothetical protein
MSAPANSVIFMTSLRAGADLKFARAQAHLNTLEEQVKAFHASTPITLSPELEPGTGALLHRAVVHKRPPVEWSLLVGDAVHNARSALDHIAWGLVEAGGGKPTRDTCFPIGDTEAAFNKSAKKALAGAAQSSIDAVSALKPWQGGDPNLWRLHQLDIVDKHRLLLAVSSASSGIFLMPNFPNLPAGTGTVWIPSLPSGPIHNGDVVLRVEKGAQTPGGPDSGVTFNVTFAPGSIVENQPMMPVLCALIEHVPATVAPLLSLLS